jgi:hypothetical protein
MRVVVHVLQSLEQRAGHKARVDAEMLGDSLDRENY